MDSRQDHGNVAPPPPGNDIFNYPPNTANTQANLPNVDLNDIIKSCDDAKKGVPVDSGKVLGDMLGMIVHMFAKQSEQDATKQQVHSNTDRIEQLEAKVGDADEVAYPRSIAVRKLPLPPHGVSEVQNAQHYLKEIKAQGVDTTIDVVKAVRKETKNHNPNLGPNLGTVLVELRNEEVRAKIMKTKKDLSGHPSNVLRSLIIKNALTPAEMKAQNTNFGLLKMITGNDNFFIAGNGMIKKKEENHRNYNQRFPDPQDQQRVLPNQAQGNPANQNQNIPNLNQSDNLQVRPTPAFTLRPNFPQAPPRNIPSSLFANYAPTFPPFQFPPPVPSVSAPVQPANTDNPRNLLDFDFMPVARDDLRSGSPLSTRSSSPAQQSEGTSHTLPGHGQTQ